ncbi:MAG TPA: histidine kinase [Lapillicoccus sp.]|nr:histidine kinase [Lapillicoccus sp.]
MADPWPGDVVHTAAEATYLTARAVCVVLAAVMVVHTARTAVSRRAWLATGAAVLVLASFTWQVLAPLWFVAFPLLASVFPDGRFVPRWTVGPVLVCAVPAVVELVAPGTWSNLPWWPLFAASQLLFLGVQVHRYRRRATTEERESVRWILLGTLLTMACFALVAVAFGGDIGEGSAWSFAAASLAILPIALGIAAGVVRPRGLDVDRALHLTVIGWVAVPVLAATYAVSSALLGGWWGAAAVGAAAWPVGVQGRRVADWMVYRGRPDAAEATSRMLAQLGERAAFQSVPAIVLDVAVEAVYLDAGRITGTWFEPVERGTVEQGAAFPVTYRSDELAVLELSPRRGESGFTTRDRRVLAALLSHAAPAMHGARTLADLHESRARLVTAREEERRRLRRELHDSLGPALSGLSLSAAALARRTGLPEATELHHDIQDVVRQTREIAYELRPPILDDHGLVAAIVDHTAANDQLDVRVSAPEPLALPAAVDLAALRIVIEAVANIRKHAQARNVAVDLAVRDERLELSVSDDGRGLPADVRPGIGMHSIAERAAELGGSAHYDQAAFGCRLLVTLPLGTSMARRT